MHGFLCLRHIRVHIRAPEGNARFTASKSARSPHIRPQRKFACSRFFQISSIFVPSFPVTFPILYPAGLSFPYLSGGFDVCIIFPLTQFVNRLIPVFCKLHFVHEILPIFCRPACAFRIRVGLFYFSLPGSGQI